MQFFCFFTLTKLGNSKCTILMVVGSHQKNSNWLWLANAYICIDKQNRCGKLFALSEERMNHKAY